MPMIITSGRGSLSAYLWCRTINVSFLFATPAASFSVQLLISRCVINALFSRALGFLCRLKLRSRTAHKFGLRLVSSGLCGHLKLISATSTAQRMSHHDREPKEVQAVQQHMQQHVAHRDRRAFGSTGRHQLDHFEEPERRDWDTNEYPNSQEEYPTREVTHLLQRPGKNEQRKTGNVSGGRC